MKFTSIKTQILLVLISLTLSSCASKIKIINEPGKISDEIEHKFTYSDNSFAICVILDKSLVNKKIKITQNSGLEILFDEKLNENSFENNCKYLFVENAKGSLVFVDNSFYFIPSYIFYDYRYVEIFKKDDSKNVFFKFTNKTNCEIDYHIFKEN